MEKTIDPIMEKIKQHKLTYLKTIRNAIVQVVNSDFEIEQFCKGHTILAPEKNEELNTFMTRIWKTKEETGSEVSAIFEELHITTEGMRDVNDMHASALEDVYTGPYGAIFKGLDEAPRHVLGSKDYIKYMMDKSVTAVKPGDGTLLDKIEKELTLATFREEEIFTSLHAHNGHTFVESFPDQDISAYMQDIWNAQTQTTPAFGVHGKLHISTQDPETGKPFRDVNDMHASALEEVEARLASENNTAAPVWQGLKVARYLNAGMEFALQQKGITVKQIA